MQKNKKDLVTGADGFIGSHLSEALVRRNFDVKAFVFYNSFNYSYDRSIFYLLIY